MNPARETGAGNGPMLDAYGFPHAGRTRRGWGWACVFGLLVGLVYFLPHVLFIADCWPEYHYPFLGSPDERYYCGLIRESGEGDLLPSSPYLLEHKGRAIPVAMATAALVALAAKAVSLPYEQAGMLLDFLAPAGIFLILYALLMLVTGSVWLSIVGAATVLMGSVFMLGVPNLLLVGTLKLGAQLGWLTSIRGLPVEEAIPNTSFIFARLIAPQVNFLLFGAALIFLTRLVRKTGMATAVGLGLSTGALFYVAPFYWMYLFAGVGVLSVYLLLKKDVETIKHLALAVGTALIVAIPWLYSTGRFLLLPEVAQETDVGRYALHVMERVPVFSKREILPTLLFLVFFPRKDRLYFYLASLLLGGLICENQHLVTGLQFGLMKYVMYTNGPVVWVALFALLWRLGTFKSRVVPVRWFTGHPRIMTLLCLLGLFANGVGTQLIFYRADVRRPLPAYEASAQRWKLYQSYHPEFEWLKQHGTDTDVVLASDEVSTLIPCFTQLNVLVSHFAYTAATLPRQELHERWFLKLKFFGITPEEVRDYLDTHILHSTNTPTMWYIELKWGVLRFKDEAAYFELLDRVCEDYAAFYDRDLLEEMQRYQVTHVWLSRFEDEEFLLTQRGIDPGRRPFLERVYASERAVIYAVRDAISAGRFE